MGVYFGNGFLQSLDCRVLPWPLPSVCEYHIKKMTDSIRTVVLCSRESSWLYNNYFGMSSAWRWCEPSGVLVLQMVVSVALVNQATSSMRSRSIIIMRWRTLQDYETRSTVNGGKAPQWPRAVILFSEWKKKEQFKTNTETSVTLATPNLVWGLDFSSATYVILCIYQWMIPENVFLWRVVWDM